MDHFLTLQHIYRSSLYINISLCEDIDSLSLPLMHLFFPCISLFLCGCLFLFLFLSFSLSFFSLSFFFSFFLFLFLSFSLSFFFSFFLFLFLSFSLSFFLFSPPLSLFNVSPLFSCALRLSSKGQCNSWVGIMSRIMTHARITPFDPLPSALMSSASAWAWAQRHTWSPLVA